LWRVKTHGVLCRDVVEAPLSLALKLERWCDLLVRRALVTRFEDALGLAV
jgi:hypothetical protein